MSDPIEAAAGALDVIFAEQLENVRTCTPLFVMAFTPGSSTLSATCECQPAVPDTLPNGNPGKVVPVLSERPVWYPGGGGTFIYWPVVTGDTALGLVSDRSLAAWSLSRTPGLPSAPELPHFHQISDTQVLPLTDRPGIPDGDPGLATDLIIGTATGVAIRIAGATGEVAITTPAATITVAVDGTITLEGVTVKLGGPAATLGVARLTDTVAADAGMTAWIAQAQVVLAAAAALTATPVPTPPIDFGVIDSSSSGVLSE